MAKWDFDIDGLMPSSIGFYAAPTLFMMDWDDSGKRDTIKDWGVWFNKVSTTHNFNTVFPFQLAGDDPYADKYSPYKNGKKRKWCRILFARGDGWLEYFPMSIFIERDGMLVEDKSLINWTQLAIMKEEFENGV